MQPDTTWYVLVRNLVISRRETIFAKVESAIYLARMFLLTYSLKLPGHTFLQPIFISLCGLFQASCAVFKSMKGKKPFKVLKIEDIQKKQQQAQGSQQRESNNNIVIPFEIESVPASPRGRRLVRERGFSLDNQEELSMKR